MPQKDIPCLIIIKSVLKLNLIALQSKIEQKELVISLKNFLSQMQT